ncbi:hypothetical protein T439DRAFT_322950 [Meredithblackwellia eburnea MCA 4105]
MFDSESRPQDSHPPWFRLNPVSHEPFVQLGTTSNYYIITPQRRQDIHFKVEAVNHASIQPWLYGPPIPATEEWAAASTEKEISRCADILDNWPSESDSHWPLGCPFRVVRRIDPDTNKDVYCGDFHLVREGAFLDVPDLAQRETLAKHNLDRRPGDPDIIWTLGFYAYPSEAGKGIMTAALSLVLQWSAKVLNVHKIHSSAFSGNEGSRKLHLKLGFVEAGSCWIDMPHGSERARLYGARRELLLFRWTRPDVLEHPTLVSTHPATANEI